jgi:signal transduction histidine kinase
MRSLSLRRKMFLSLVLAVGCAALLEGTLDYLENRNELDSTVDRNLNLFADEVALLLDTSGERPTLEQDATAHLARWEGGHFRVLYNGQLRYLYNEPFPQEFPENAFTERDLGQGYRLEAVLDTALYQARFRREMRADLLSDNPLFLAVGLGIAFLLTYFILQPVRRLSEALHNFSLQRHPEPLPVPPGNDELSRLVRTYNTMSATIGALLERERIFTRYASHELRSPLSAIKLQLESIELGLASLDEVSPALNRNIVRMESTINALLSMARASDIGESAHLGPILAGLVETLPESERTRVSLLVEPLGDTKVLGANLVRQAVGNLLENAVKYTQGAIIIQAAPSSQLRHVRLIVRDEGPGVPTDKLSELTKPFFRLEKDATGSGLGLALVKHIAHTLAADLSLRNMEKGFEVVLDTPTVD